MIGTAGGTFNPADRHLYFLAGQSDQQVHTTMHPNVLVAVNDYMSDRRLHELDGMLELGCRVMLDSGIFWLTNEHARAHRVTMDVALGLPPTEIDGFKELRARLGMTPNEWLNAFHVDSCDSSSWLNVVRWGGHKPDASLRRYGSMDQRYTYRRRDLAGANKAARHAASAFTMSERYWKHGLARVRELVGCDDYPPFPPGELLPHERRRAADG